MKIILKKNGQAYCFYTEEMKEEKTLRYSLMEDYMPLSKKTPCPSSSLNHNAREIPNEYCSWIHCARTWKK